MCGATAKAGAGGTPHPSRDTHMRKSVLLASVSLLAFFPWKAEPDLNDFGMGEVWSLR